MKAKSSFPLLLLFFYWGQVLLPAAGGSGGRVVAATVTSFVLVNADTDLDLFVMTPGMTLDLNSLPTQNLNIRAEVDSTVGSVTFALRGAQDWDATENVTPYALFSDYLGDYFAWAPPLGSYTLTATPYAAGGGTGPAGVPLTLSFTVVNAAFAVTSFTLVNADTDLDILPLVNNKVLNTSFLPTQNLNIRANADAAFTGSVVFSLTGAVTWTATENLIPYALFSDISGDYFAWTPPAGSYTLTATPFSAADGTGNAGTPLTISFTVMTNPLPVQLAAFTARALSGTEVDLRWQTASELNNQEFEVQRSLDGRQFSAVGRVPGHGNSSLPHAYAYTDRNLPAQAALLYYRLRQLDFDGTATYSPVQVVAMSRHAVALLVASPLLPAEAVQYSFSGPLTGDENLQLYNMVGQCLGRYPVAAGGAGAVPVAGLAAGSYVLRLASREGSFTGRFVLP